MFRLRGAIREGADDLEWLQVAGSILGRAYVKEISAEH